MAEADLWSYLTTAVSEPNCARCHWETASAPTQIERGWLKSDKVSHTLFSYKWYSLLWAAAVQFHGQWAMVIWLHAYDNQQNPAGFWKYATKNHWFISLIIVKSIFSPVKSPVFSHGIHMFGTKSRHAWDPNQLPGRHGAWHKDIDDIDFYWFLLIFIVDRFTNSSGFKNNWCSFRISHFSWIFLRASQWHRCDPLSATILSALHLSHGTMGPEVTWTRPSP